MSEDKDPPASCSIPTPASAPPRAFVFFNSQEVTIVHEEGRTQKLENIRIAAAVTPYR